jgi:AraC family transcriptional regulator, arabinose operon regulatory protein
MMKAAPSQSAHEVAARLKLSTSRLRHLFKQGVGAPLGHYLKHLRLHRAKRLIETSRFTLARVMSEVGETDESHFRRDFKKHFGVPPAECRAAARGATVAAEKDDEPA